MSNNALTDALFGDPDTDRHLTGQAELAAMIRFEAALAEAEAAHGVIPAEAGPAIAQALDGFEIDPADLAAATASARVPIPALVAALRAHVGEPHGGFVHWGATSQDVMDTGLVLRVREILGLFEARLCRIIDQLADRTEAHANLPMAGRTRTQIATPITFGLRIAGWLMPLVRCLDRLAELRPRLLLVQLGGASGSLSVLGDKGPAVTADLAQRLRLGIPVKPWHTERDGIMELGNWLAMVTGLLGRIGADLAIMGRSEIAEARAGSAGGSSTMPQKANPVGAEALVTLARSAAGHSALLHQALLFTEERDGVAWGLEWTALPPLLTATGAALRHAVVLAETLEPDAEAMARNMGLGGGAIHAEALAFALADQMPLGEAQALVKQAARQDGDLAGNVAALCSERKLSVPDISDQGQSSSVRLAIAAVAAARNSLKKRQA